MRDDGYLGEEECRPNLNTVVIAGAVGPVQTEGKGTAFFTIAVEKHWPDGGHSTVTIPVRAKAQPCIREGATLVVKGELAAGKDGALGVYGLAVEDCADAGRGPWR